MKYCKQCGVENLLQNKSCDLCGCEQFEFRCARCGTVFENAEKCPSCGLEAGREKQSCPNCGGVYYTNACPNCGYTKDPSKPDRLNVSGLIGTILGAVGIILCFMGFGYILGIPAIALGLIGILGAKKYNMKKGLAIAALILGAVALLVSIILTTACGVAYNELQKAGIISSETAEKAPLVRYSVGTKAEQNGIAVTLVRATVDEGSAFSGPAEGKVFVICEFEIENNSKEDITVSTLLGFEAYCDSYAVSQSTDAVGLTDDNRLGGSVAAGKKMNGVIGYELPSGWKELEVRYTPSLLGEPLCFVATH